MKLFCSVDKLAFPTFQFLSNNDLFPAKPTSIPPQLNQSQKTDISASLDLYSISLTFLKY